MCKTDCRLANLVPWPVISAGMGPREPKLQQSKIMRDIRNMAIPGDEVSSWWGQSGKGTSAHVREGFLEEKMSAWKHEEGAEMRGGIQADKGAGTKNPGWVYDWTFPESWVNPEFLGFQMPFIRSLFQKAESQDACRKSSFPFFLENKFTVSALSSLKELGNEKEDGELIQTQEAGAFFTCPLGMTLSLIKTSDESLPHAENQIERMWRAMVWMHICLHLDSEEAKHCIDLQITQGHWKKTKRSPGKINSPQIPISGREKNIQAKELS